MIAELAQEQAKVGNWPGYIGWAVGIVIVIGLVYWLMRQGWNWRRTLQSDLPELAAAPEDLGPVLLTAKGRYHGTTTAGAWLDRIVAHGLGLRSLAELTLTEQGLLARRPGAEDLWIPAEALTGARLDSGIAGKVVPAGLLVITWTLPQTPSGGAPSAPLLDSGFRADHPDEHAAWVTAVETLVTRSTKTMKKTEEAAS